MTDTLSRLEQLYLCRASGEGTHTFRVCNGEPEVMAFCEEMFGKDQDGTLDSFASFSDSDEWCGNEGSRSLQWDLYCATFECWEVDPKELEHPALRAALEAAEIDARTNRSLWYFVRTVAGPAFTREQLREEAKLMLSKQDAALDAKEAP